MKIIPKINAQTPNHVFLNGQNTHTKYRFKVNLPSIFRPFVHFSSSFFVDALFVNYYDAHVAVCVFSWIWMYWKRSSMKSKEFKNEKKNYIIQQSFGYFLTFHIRCTKKLIAPDRFKLIPFLLRNQKDTIYYLFGIFLFDTFNSPHKN